MSLTPPAPRYLLDSNILLRSLDKAHPHHGIVRRAIPALMAEGALLHPAAQSLVEFWAVATRPTAVNGLGLTPALAQVEIANFKAAFTRLEDAPGIYPEWERLVTTYAVIGKQAHDARLVAAMHVFGLTHLLTFNVSDFRRYQTAEDIIVVDPAQVPVKS